MKFKQECNIILVSLLKQRFKIDFSLNIVQVHYKKKITGSSSEHLVLRLVVHYCWIISLLFSDLGKYLLRALINLV